MVLNMTIEESLCSSLPDVTIFKQLKNKWILPFQWRGQTSLKMSEENFGFGLIDVLPLPVQLQPLVIIRSPP